MVINSFKIRNKLEKTAKEKIFSWIWRELYSANSEYFISEDVNFYGLKWDFSFFIVIV